MYNKLVIFDLDGVLVDSRDMHYETLNAALRKYANYEIPYAEHLSTFDGLSTTKKLNLLKSRGIINGEDINEIWKYKQDATLGWIRANAKPNTDLIYLFKWLKEEGYKLAVCSNSISKTLLAFLEGMKLDWLLDTRVSNEDVQYPKPYPEMYWKAMTRCQAIPATTIIIEDSHIGRQGAVDSGARLLPVENPSDVTFFKISNRIEQMNDVERKPIPWRDSKLNVLIPMAGAGSRFAQAGFTFPKPLIEVNGKPMIQVVVENLNIEANYIFIVQKDHYAKYDLENVLENIAPNCEIVVVDGLTEGAACTTLLAKEFINSDAPLLIANSDQYVEWNSNECMYAFKQDAIDGGILSFKANHPKWSYSKVDANGFVAEVAEKKVISDNATVGIYYWKHGADYVRYAERMVAKNIRTNGEFYIAPVYNEAIQDGKLIRLKEVSRMWGIGTPEDLEYFLKNHG